MMTRSERKLRRWIWSLAAGVLLVPIMAVGAIANTSIDEKEARGTGHTHVGIVDTADHKAFHGTTSGIDHDDHPVFDTPAEHKDFHGLPSGIDHDDHPVFDTPAEHKAYHDIIARFVRDDSARDEVISDDQTDHQEVNDDGDADAVELKEQPLDRTEENSTGHTRDRSERNQESREERSN